MGRLTATRRLHLANLQSSSLEEDSFRCTHCVYQMCGCQKCFPFLGPLNTRCRMIRRTHRRTISFTTTHISQRGRRRAHKVIKKGPLDQIRECRTLLLEPTTLPQQGSRRLKPLIGSWFHSRSQILKNP